MEGQEGTNRVIWPLRLFWGKGGKGLVRTSERLGNRKKKSRAQRAFPDRAEFRERGNGR